MIKKFLLLLGGLLFVPICIGFTVAFYDQLLILRRVQQPEIAMLLGVTTYLAIHVLVGAPSRAYVFGHEMTHATATWVTGGQVKGMKVGSNKGSVTVNKVTALIALAPYLVPAYAVGWAILYGLASLFWDVRPYVFWFFFGLGAGLAFHLVFTVQALKEKQPDLDVMGPVLSLGIIYWANLTLVIGVMALIVPDVHFGQYLAQGTEHAIGIVQDVYRQLFVH